MLNPSHLSRAEGDIVRSHTEIVEECLRQRQGKRDAPDAENYQPCGGLATAWTQRIENSTMTIQAYQHQGKDRDIDREDSDCWAESAKERGEVPALKQDCLKLEWNSKEADEDISSGKVGDEQVGRLAVQTPGGEDDIDDKGVASHS